MSIGFWQIAIVVFLVVLLFGRGKISRFMGVVAKGEKCLSTSNRNFPGRMGHPEGEVFLSNPSVAAATAITGRITHPEEIISADSVLSAMKGS